MRSMFDASAKFSRLAIVAALTGCSSAPSAAPMPSVPGASALRGPAIGGFAAARNARSQGKSWWTGNAKSGDQFFVSDVANAVVKIYRPNGKLTGTLTGFTSPVGLAVDASRNLYVGDYQAEIIQVFAPGSTAPSVLSDAGWDPIGVAVSLTGEVAGIGLVNTSGGPGAVSIYEPGASSPSRVVSGLLVNLYNGAYDHSGNLYVTGIDSHITGHVVEIPSGGSTMNDLGALPYVPKDVKVTKDGSLHVLDPSGALMHNYTIVSGQLNQVSTTALSSTYYAAGLAFYKSTKKFLIANAFGSVQKYAFPAGGGSLKSYQVGGATDGVAVVPWAAP